jgi:hypothetical protein
MVCHLLVRITKFLHQFKGKFTMNSDTLPLIASLAYPAGHPLLLAPAVSATGTTQTAFLLANGNVALGQVPTQTAIMGSMTMADPNSNPSFSGPASPYNPNAHVMAPYFNSGSFDLSRPFRVRAVGTFTSGNAANSLAIAFFVGTSATAGSDTSFYAPAATTAIASGAKGQFWLEATCLWDSGSGKLAGIGESTVTTGTAPFNARALIAQISVAAYTSLSFVCFYTWGVGASANTIQLSEFGMERV